MRKILAALFIALLGVVVACSGSTRRPANQNPYIGDGNDASAGGQWPAECAGAQIQQENILDANQEMVMVKCSCTAGNRRVSWYNTVNATVAPQDYCHPGVTYFGEDVVATTASASATAIVLPTATAPDASLPPMPTVAVFPSPTATTSATASAPPATSSTAVPYRLEYRDVHYKCSNGVASRTYKAITESNGSRVTVNKQQQCTGPGFTCLTNMAEQNNPDLPPCGCEAGRRISLFSAENNTWACIQPAPSPATSK